MSHVVLQSAVGENNAVGWYIVRNNLKYVHFYACFKGLSVLF